MRGDPQPLENPAWLVTPTATAVAEAAEAA
jgi:hypothetical protein